MKPFPFLMVVLAATAMAGCSTRSLVTPDGRAIFRSSRLGTREQVKEVRYRTKDGAEFTLRGYSSDQVEALAAVTEAAVRAAISSQNPSGAGFNLGQFVVPAGMKSPNAQPLSRGDGSQGKEPSR